MAGTTHDLSASGTSQPGCAAFDELAVDYDATFTATRLGRWLRSVVWQRTDAGFPAGGRLLDIGCGTGEDAIHFARIGHEVLAVDASAAMLDLAREKAGRAGCASRIEFRRVPMERLGAELGEERFDGAFSNFGVINCAATLEQLVADVATSLKPGAPLVWVVMGRYVPWEWAWFAARLDGQRAFRRLRKGGAGWRGTRIRYPTPRELARILRPHFAAARSSPLGVVLPPSYASGWLERRPGLFSALALVERAAQRVRPLAALSDHYIIEARRSPYDTDD